MRAERRRLSSVLTDTVPDVVLHVANRLIETDHQWLGFELINAHAPTMKALTLRDVEHLGRNLDAWHHVDPFGGYIAGPCWRLGRISNAAVLRWTARQDLWWRRAALVATTHLNLKSRGGSGDTDRTLAVAERLVADREDMVINALSWALRSLAPWDPVAVSAFLAKHDLLLAARVKREVRNKLRSGLKNPPRT